MADKSSKVKEFPDIANKLTAPTKKSIFEKQKADAEAKKLREQEETAAVYQDFVKSFDDDDNEGLANASYGGGPPRRHFGTSSAGRVRGLSGPGSLGPVPAVRKPPFDGPTGRRDARPMFAFEDTTATGDHSDDEEKRPENAAPKPTVHLSSLPPGTSPAVIKSILPFKIDGVRITTPSGPASSDRGSISAIVTLAKETAVTDIDAAVSALQNRYLGWGFYLSISRHLSSAVSSALPVLSTTSKSTLPFGARPVTVNTTKATPISVHPGGFAPPTSYNSSQYNRGAPTVQVNVRPPTDLKQLKLIHRTVENVLTHGPEFEALLMSRVDVQKDEKWAWIWDATSTGGVWYRWRLWDVLTGAQRRMRLRDANIQHQVFANAAAWSAPESVLPFEYTTKLDDVVSDSDYNSSEDEDSGDEGRRRLQHLQGRLQVDTDPAATDDGSAYLNPLRKAKLVHLLSRLPRSNATLRRGDVARITGYAIQHAGSGADEVVELITSNIHNPFAMITSQGTTGRGEDHEMNNGDVRTIEKEDSSPMKLIGLYLISDILSSSSTSGVRHAWRYRQLFEQSLRRKKTFEHLGRLEKEMAWGRLKAEKWKRSVLSVLSLWEGWCVFPVTTQEEFVQTFTSPPLTDKERKAAEVLEMERLDKEKSRSKWKPVEEKAKDAAQAAAAAEIAAEPGADMHTDRVPMQVDDEDLDGVPMEDEDLDGEPMEDEDLDGEPMEEDDVVGTPLGGDATNDQRPENDSRAMADKEMPRPSSESKMKQEASIEITASKLATVMVEKATPEVGLNLGARRQRPRAQDMFADSDGE